MAKWLIAIVVTVGCSSHKDAPPAPATGSAIGSAVAPTPPPVPEAPVVAKVPAFRVGQAVMGLWPQDGKWYPGKIIAITHEDLYRVKYDDGDVSEPLAPASLKPR